MGKNFSTYPKETEADQSRARRPGLVDRRYVFSASVPGSKGDEQICSLLSTSSSGGAETRGLLFIAANSMRDASISQDKQSRINKLRCVSMKTTATFTAGSLQRRTTKHAGGSGTGSRSQRLSTISDHFIKTNPVQRRRNPLPASFCLHSPGNMISFPFLGTRIYRNQAPNQYKHLKVTAFSKSQPRKKRNTNSAAIIAYSHDCDWCVIN